MLFSQISKEIGRRWKELSEEERRPYQEAYEVEKKEWEMTQRAINGSDVDNSKKAVDTEQKQETE